MSVASYHSVLRARRPVRMPERERRELGLAIPLAALGCGAVVALSAALNPIAPIALVALFVAALVVFKRPELGLPIALVLLWTDAAGVASFHYGAPTATAVIVPLMLVLPLAAGYLRGERMRVDAGFVWLLVFLLVEVLAGLASAYQSVGLARVEKTIQEGVIVYLLLINVVRTPATLRTASWSLIAGGVVLGLLTAIQVLGHKYDHSFLGFALPDHQFLSGKDTTFRAQGPLADANYYAQILVPSLVLAVVAVFREPARRARLVAAACASVLLLAIVFTYSRGAALAVGVVILLFAAFKYLRLPHLVVIAAVIGVVLVAFPSYASRLSSLGGLSGATAQVGSSNAAELSIQQRATENLAAWLAIEDHPLLGLGPDVFPIVYQHYAQEAGGAIHQASRHTDSQGDRAGEAPQRSVPDIFESVVADDGLIGLSVLLCLISWALVGLLRVRRRHRRKSSQLEAMATGYFVALVGYVVSGAFLAFAFSRYFWSLLALCGAAMWILMQAEADPVASSPARRLPGARGRRGGIVPETVGADLPQHGDEISHAGVLRSDTLDRP